MEVEIAGRSESLEKTDFLAIGSIVVGRRQIRKSQRSRIP